MSEQYHLTDDPDFWDQTPTALQWIPALAKARGLQCVAYPLADQSNDVTAPVALVGFLPPHWVEERHSHDVSRIKVVIEGSFTAEDGTELGPGSLLMGRAAASYGPWQVGPEGCMYFEAFATQRGALRRYQVPTDCDGRSTPNGAMAAAVARLQGAPSGEVLADPAIQQWGKDAIARQPVLTERMAAQLANATQTERQAGHNDYQLTSDDDYWEQTGPGLQWYVAFSRLKIALSNGQARRGALRVLADDPSDPSAPTILIGRFPPNWVEERHSHEAPRLKMSIQGSLIIEDGRVLQPGSLSMSVGSDPYGPWQAGTDGCTYLEIFANQVGMPPKYEVFADELGLSTTDEEIADAMSRLAGVSVEEAMEDTVLKQWAADEIARQPLLRERMESALASERH